jgi:hypothetical protein
MNRSLIGLILLVLLVFTAETGSLAQELPKITLDSHFQDVRTFIALPDGADHNVLKLFRSHGQIIAVTPSGVYRHRDGHWTGNKTGAGWETAALDPGGNLWLVSGSIIEREDQSLRLTLPSAAKNDTILCLFWESEDMLHVGTTSGMYTYTSNWSKEPALRGTRVRAIVKGANNTLWVATSTGLFRRTLQWLNLDRRLMAPANQHAYFALETAKGAKDLLYSTPRAVGYIADDGNHWLVSGPEGLPYGPATVIRTVGGSIWYGTEKGAIKKDAGWHYYHGKRWIPNNRVHDILPIDDRTVWIATPQGISQIQSVEMTLNEKSDWYLDIAEKRHVRRGLVNRSVLDIPGDVASSRTENQDNDGKWTSVYLAAECFRFAVTKDPEAREHAIRTFRALEMLEKVTGIPGYPARSFAKSTDKVAQSRSPHPKKWRPSPDGEWQWLDDTSSDEITGHIFALALFHDLVANKAQKADVVALIRRILDHIINNDFQLIDYDGKATRWGIWNPDSLNNNPNWIVERGVNSLQILSFLKTASHITQDKKYEKVYQELIEKHGYVQNIPQVKLYGPFENSYAETGLIFLPFYHLIKYGAGDPYLPLYIQSLKRTWSIVREDRIPVWNIMSSAILKKDCDLQIALEQLQLYPVDLVNWSMENSHRWDIQQHPLVDRRHFIQATKPISPPEGDVWRWNTNPKKLDSGAAGKREESGSFFLFAYWMARYHGLFVE